MIPKLGGKYKIEYPKWDGPYIFTIVNLSKAGFRAHWTNVRTGYSPSDKEGAFYEYTTIDGLIDDGMKFTPMFTEELLPEELFEL